MIEIFAERRIHSQTVGVYVVQVDPLQKTMQVPVVEWRESGLYEEMQPTFNLMDKQTQQLFNTLWAAGYRPEQESTEGMRQAMESHISDLRKIAFKMVGVK